MYKLFLCLRFLCRRIIAYLAIGVVALCVFMMLTVVSVMNGFLHKVEIAAKGLFGDVVVETGSLTGLADYEAFIERIEANVPEVEAAAPFIFTYGILRVPDTDFRRTIQIAGVPLPKRAAVSDFEKGLLFQKNWAKPTWDVSAAFLLQKLSEETAATRKILERLVRSARDEPLPPEKQDTIQGLQQALRFHRIAAEKLQDEPRMRQEIRRLQAKMADARKRGEAKEVVEELEELIDAYRKRCLDDWQYRVILGHGIPGLTFRTEAGETVRVVPPGLRIGVVLLPLGKRISAADITPVRRMFTIVDECKTDVSTIDSDIIYVPLQTLQTLNDMVEEYEVGGRKAVRKRCSQVHVKVRRQDPSERHLREVATKVRREWAAFEADHPDPFATRVIVQTWREKQVRLVSTVEAQRTLVVTMFGVISLAAIAVIFVILYMIVLQKTRDIGVIKAVGGSAAGVAQIFLGYGAVIGLIGSAAGTAGAFLFVRDINAIHDAVGRWIGFTVFSREWYMFDKIPNEVDWQAAQAIVLGAILSGLAGALLPALRAARMQPVEALRYE